jgi:hypothetical protein
LSGKRVAFTSLSEQQTPEAASKKQSWWANQLVVNGFGGRHDEPDVLSLSEDFQFIQRNEGDDGVIAR